MDEEKIGTVQPETAAPVEQEAVQEVSADEKSMGPVLGSIIVVIILVVAAFYVWGTGVDSDTDDAVAALPVNNGEEPPIEDVIIEEAAPVPDPATEALKTQGTSDEIADIEADLNATDLSNLDAELDAIDTKLQ